MNIFNTTASGLIQHFLGSGVFSKPSGIAFGLTSTAPTNASITELANSNGYARQNYGQNTTTFTAVNALWSFPLEGSGVAYNNNQIIFPVATPGAWGMISGAFIADSSTYGGGNNLFYCNLSVAQDIGLNFQFYIPVSGAQVRFY